MSRLNIQQAERLAQKLRADMGLNDSEPIHTKTILRKENIVTMYLPLSENVYGLSLKHEGHKFMLINSTRTRGRQHFTIAHELYHLYVEDNPSPHICSNGKDTTEKNADMFASAFLMPSNGINANIATVEIKNKNISLATIIRLEQYFSVSRKALLIRLRNLNLLSQSQFDEYCQTYPIKTAKDYGYDISLYKSGNTNLVLGDFGTLARTLFENDIISEGNYFELLNQIPYDEE